MLRMFVRDGHCVHVVLPDNGPLIDLLEMQGVIVHVLPSLAVIERTALRSVRGKLLFCFRSIYSVCVLTALIISLKTDIVHTNTSVLPTPALAARLSGRRHIWHIREFFVEFPGIWMFYQRYISILSSNIITISDAVRDQFEPRVRNKCLTIYNSLGSEAGTVNLDTAAKFRSSVGKPTLLVGVVGRIKWVRKGQEVLIKAAALLADKYPDVRYAIVGSVSVGNDDHLARLQKLVQDKQLNSKVIFIGDIAQPRDIYAAFDITVVPSVLPEPFGRVVMESMAAGTPVVASRCGGIPEQIIAGETGLLFNPGDEEDLAKSLAELFDDKARRLRMGIEGRRYALGKFDDDVVYQKYAELFGVQRS